MIEVEGLDALLERLGNIADEKAASRAIERGCLLVERVAKQKAPKGGGGDSSGENLRGSITTRVDGLTGEVFTPLEYAPYVEYGTGKFATKGGRTELPWVFVKNSAKKKGTGRKDYTEETAKQAVAVLREKGLDAYYTYGQQPRPFLNPALEENRDRIMEIIKGALLNND